MSTIEEADGWENRRTNVIELDLSQMGKDALLELISAIQPKLSVTRDILDLEMCKAVESVGITALTDAIQKNNSLVWFEFESDVCYDMGITTKEQIKTSVDSLELSNVITTLRIYLDDLKKLDVQYPPSMPILLPVENHEFHIFQKLLITHIRLSFVMALKGKCLTRLYFSGIADQEMEAISEIAIDNMSLVDLQLAFTYRLDGMMALAKSLLFNTSITNLNLDWNDWTADDALLIKSLANNKTIKTLSLFPAEIDSSDFIMEFSKILNETNIENLVITGKWMGLCSARALATAIKSNLKIASLSIQVDNNPLVVPMLFDGVQINESIKDLELILTCNGETRASPKLVEMLGENNFLEKVNVSTHFDSSISTTSELIDVLKNNTNLTSVTIHNQCLQSDEKEIIPTETLHEMFEKLKQNFVILYLELPSTTVMTDFREQWQVIDERNITLLKQGISFIINPTVDKTKAYAFEKVRNSPALFKKLIMLGNDTNEASNLIVKARHFVNANFMQLIGVHSTRLLCYCRDDGAVQFDALNLDVRTVICGYLDIGDYVRMLTDQS